MRVFKFSPAGSLVSEAELPYAMAADVLASDQYSTAEVPPERTATHAPLWVDGAWTLAPDLRGSGWHNPATGEEIIIREVGQQPPAGWVEGEAPQPVEPLESAKARKNSAINAARLRANQSHFTFAGKQIAVDPLSRSDIDAAHGAILMLQSLPGGWPGAWKAMDNTYVSIPDVATWGAFYGAMVAQGTANFAHAQALKAQLAAATTPEEVEAVPVW